MNRDHEQGVPAQAALTVAILCGIVAFTWALLASVPPEAAPARARWTRAPDAPDALLAWLAEGNGDDDARAWRHAGEILHWRGDAQGAREAWRRAAELAQARGSRGRGEEYTLAWSLARLEDSSAGRVVRRVVRRMREEESGQRGWSGAPVSRALLLRLIGDEAGVQAELARAQERLDEDADSARDVFLRARIEALLGRPEAALAALERAAEMGGRVRGAGRARWAMEFGDLRNDPRFQRAIERLGGEP